MTVPAPTVERPPTEPARTTNWSWVAPGTVLVLAILLALLGVTTLGSNANSTFSFVGSSIRPVGTVASAPAAAGRADGQAAPAAAANDPNPAAPPVQAERKIIYTATLEVVVKDLDAATAGVTKLLADSPGSYVAKSEQRTDSGARRTATYTLRVPADRFRPLIDGLAALGHAERNALDSQDVTEEFVDTQARLRNLKKEEETLNKLLEQSGSRDEVLRTRAEIRAIRGEIERSQARLDYLTKLTALSTVNLTLREIKDYTPPTAPTFGDRAGSTFGASWAALEAFGKNAALVAVALAAWLPVLIPVGIGAWVLSRRRRKQPAAQ
jgi:hypothetical protein